MEVRSARLTGSRDLARRRHRPPAIERHLLKQAAMFIATGVRSEAHYGLKPDSEPSPKSAKPGNRRRVQIDLPDCRAARALGYGDTL
jgi:hypothetical protein